MRAGPRSAASRLLRPRVADLGSAGSLARITKGPSLRETYATLLSPSSVVAVHPMCKVRMAHSSQRYASLALVEVEMSSDAPETSVNQLLKDVVDELLQGAHDPNKLLVAVVDDLSGEEYHITGIEVSDNKLILRVDANEEQDVD